MQDKSYIKDLLFVKLEEEQTKSYAIWSSLLVFHFLSFALKTEQIYFFSGTSISKSVNI